MEALNFIGGLAYLAGLVFAIVVFFDAITVPGARWFGPSKGGFFVAWYVGGIFTVGLVPIGMSVWYWRKLRPALRPMVPVENPHHGVLR